MKIYKSDMESIRKNQTIIAEMARLARKLKGHNYDVLADSEHRIKRDIETWENQFADLIKELRKEEN